MTNLYVLDKEYNFIFADPSKEIRDSKKAPDGQQHGHKYLHPQMVLAMLSGADTIQLDNPGLGSLSAGGREHYDWHGLQHSQAALPHSAQDGNG